MPCHLKSASFTGRPSLRYSRRAASRTIGMVTAAPADAAADGRVITMDHLTHAAEREYSKLDKAATETEFGALTGAVAS